jgi:SAM-dependent methyltransferase
VEYAAMFDLDPDVLPGRVLDCSAGVSSFAAEAAARGSRVVAVDPAYALGGQQLAELGRDDLARGSAIADEHADRFTWDWYGDRERRTTLRRSALARFLADFAVHPDRYVAGALPRLPFRDGAFDLAVCSHLLFTWGDQLGCSWHADAIVELARVATEVRVFPTVLQGRGEPVPFWDELMVRLEAAGLRTELSRVPYEFQVGGNRMFVAQRRARALLTSGL